MDNILDFKTKLNAITILGKDLRPILGLQMDLLKEILSQEEFISALKNEIKNKKARLRKGYLTKNESMEIKSTIKDLKENIKSAQNSIYIYKCFGDGIAFKFIDKWNWKRFIYEIDSPDMKSDAGSLSNKDGLSRELLVLLEIFKNEVPAILNDLTNIIRYGDICLLGVNEPYVIEVKSSNNFNKRVIRQVNAVNKLHSYLTEDVADIGGFGELRRMNTINEEKHFNKDFNELFSNLNGQELIKKSPEEGIHYIAMRTSLQDQVEYEHAFEGIEQPMFFYLNILKNEQEWGNYYPFTLFIKSSKALYDFITGEVFIMVLLDLKIIKKKSKDLGLEVEIVFDGATALKFIKKMTREEPITINVSEHFFCRIPYEFVSLDWLFKEVEAQLEYIKYNIS